MSHADLDLQWSTTVTNLKDLDTQIFAALANLTEGESFDAVASAEDNGAEAWRRLTVRFDSPTPPRAAATLRKLMRQQTLEALLPFIEKWEAQARLYQRMSGKCIEEEHKHMALQEMVPRDLAEHFSLKSERFLTHVSMRSVHHDVLAKQDRRH